MASEAIVLEGTWEEMLTHNDELAGRRVRLTIITADEPYPGIPVDERPSTGASLLQFAGAWSGDDLSTRLDEVYQSRSEAQACPSVTPDTFLEPGRTLADRMAEILGGPATRQGKTSNWSEVEAPCDLT